MERQDEVAMTSIWMRLMRFASVVRAAPQLGHAVLKLVDC